MHKYEAVFCCKVFNINTLVYGLLVFSRTMRVLVQHKRKFFIKKVLQKCRKSAVFRNFAGEWRFYTYETSTLVKHFQPFFHFKILPRNRLLALVTTAVSIVERYICVVLMSSCPNPLLTTVISFPMSLIIEAQECLAT